MVKKTSKKTSDKNTTKTTIAPKPAGRITTPAALADPKADVINPPKDSSGSKWTGAINALESALDVLKSGKGSHEVDYAIAKINRAISVLGPL